MTNGELAKELSQYPLTAIATGLLDFERFNKRLSKSEEESLAANYPTLLVTTNRHSMKLFIAEKPSLARAIAAGIDVGKKSDGYISLNGGKEIVILEAAKQFKIIRELIGKATIIVNALDEKSVKQSLNDFSNPSLIMRLKLFSRTSF